MRCQVKALLASDAFLSVRVEGKSFRHGGQGYGYTSLANKVIGQEGAGFHTNTVHSGKNVKNFRQA